jgi:UPF0755 protein
MKLIQRVPKWSSALIFFLSVLGVSTWLSWSWWTWASAAPVPQGATPLKIIKLQVPEGTSAQEIGQDLQALGLIRSANAWDLWTRWLKVREPQGGFKAGTYQLSPADPLPTIAGKIWTGEVISLSFTIPEGWSLRQMAAYFEQQGYFSAQDFLTAAATFSTAQYPWIPTDLPTGAPRLEGYLYPDTYQISAPIKPEQVLKQMLDRFEQVALPIYQKQSQPKQTLTLPQWVTLASIVEKEAVIAAERPRIAGVFTNRLKQEIPLGADPTVEYALGIQQTPDKPLTLENVRTPSPYNTYLNPGLPPTPIASPGLASLKATLAPENTDYLYFVARYDGTHVFSRTLAEHTAAQEAIRDKQEAPQLKR